jgi:predicted phage-related endonuclease
MERSKSLPIPAEDREYAKKYVGATTAPVLYMDDHPYDSPYSVWLVKTGRVPEQDLSDNDAVQWGSALEKPIAEMFMKKHCDDFMDMERIEDLIVLNEAEYCATHLDYKMRRCSDNKTVLMEIKNSEMGIKKWKPEPPDQYFLQCQWEMYITGIDECYLVAKVGNSLIEHLIPADPVIQEGMRKAVDTFWNEYIVKDVMPEFRWSDADRLRDNIEGIDPALAEVRDDLIPILIQYAKDKQTWDEMFEIAKHADQAKRLGDALVLGQIKDSKARVVKVGNNSITRWEQATTSVDTKTLEKEYPEAYAKCVKKSSSGRYKINVTKIVTLQE